MHQLFVSAQYFEVGTAIGLSNYIGDLSDSKIDHSQYNLSLGVFGRYNMSPRIAFKVSLTRAELKGSDYNSRVLNNLQRNLNFRTQIIEFAAIGEFNLAKFNIPNNEISSPYVFGGIAAIYFNPQADFQGEYIDLQPLGTEGQFLNGNNKSYSRISVAFPLGLGFKFNLNHSANLGVEFGYRIAITDYIDDVSASYPDLIQLKQVNPLAAALSYRTPEYFDRPIVESPAATPRGDNKSTDSYLFVNFTVSVNLTDKFGLDFDEKYDKFKEDYQEYVKANKPINLDQKRRHRKEMRKKKKEQAKTKKQKMKEINKKKKRSWKTKNEVDESMKNPNILHPGS